MPIAWFVAKHVIVPGGVGGRASLVNPVFEFTTVAAACVDLPKGWALSKVSADSATLAAMAADARITRLPKDHLDDLLSDLTANQKQTLLTFAQTLGYSLAEINAALPGDIGSYSLRQVLRFLAKRTHVAHQDPVQFDNVIWNAAPSPVGDVDGALYGIDWVS